MKQVKVIREVDSPSFRFKIGAEFSVKDELALHWERQGLVVVLPDSEPEIKKKAVKKVR